MLSCIKPMKTLFALPFLFAATTAPTLSSEIVTFNANKACASIIGIPYASDNFSQEDFEKFKACVMTMKYFDRKFPQ